MQEKFPMHTLEMLTASITSFALLAEPFTTFGYEEGEFWACRSAAQVNARAAAFAGTQFFLGTVAIFMFRT